jgi:hypothetical protein
MAKLIVKSSAPSGREFQLKPGVNTLGRHPSNDIQLDDPSVSSFHGELHVADIGVSVKDLGSTNGTFINQKQIAKGFVRGEDLVTFGGVDCVVEVAQVNISIPDLPVVEQVTAAFLDDGAPACFTHREVAATQRCTKCDSWWCSQCVRLLKKLNGEFLSFCPECSAPCVPLAREAAPTRKGFFRGLQETLRLTRKK